MHACLPDARVWRCPATVWGGGVMLKVLVYGTTRRAPCRTRPRSTCPPQDASCIAGFSSIPIANIVFNPGHDHHNGHGQANMMITLRQARLGSARLGLARPLAMLAGARALGIIYAQHVDVHGCCPTRLHGACKSQQTRTVGEGWLERFALSKGQHFGGSTARRFLCSGGCHKRKLRWEQGCGGGREEDCELAPEVLGLFLFVRPLAGLLPHGRRQPWSASDHHTKHLEIPCSSASFVRSFWRERLPFLLESRFGNGTPHLHPSTSSFRPNSTLVEVPRKLSLRKPRLISAEVAA